MVNHMATITENALATQKLGQKIGADLKKKLSQGKPGTTLALYGELGAGKTTFLQGLAKGLGIKDRIISPTFVFMRQYPIPGTKAIFYHVDLYRVEKATDAQSLGLEEILADPEAVVALEWAEKIRPILPPKRLDIHFKYLKSQERKVEIAVKK